MNTHAVPFYLARIFERCGITPNGSQPWDIQIRDARMFRKALLWGSMGIGEAYMDGWWDCEQLDVFFQRIMAVDADVLARRINPFLSVLRSARAHLLNLQSVRRAFQVGQAHYDIGNDVFESMLDSRMIYSCAYWERADNLEAAQTDKLEMICKKLQLQPGEKMLEIGCGWGGLAAYAAKNYGVHVTGITISKEQKALADVRCAGLSVEILLQDYRVFSQEQQGQFDKVVSVGMFEHVGAKNYTVYMNSVTQLLKPHGLFLLHTIGSDVTVDATDAWIERYIFPNGYIPAPWQIAKAAEGRLLIEDWHNFGQDYDRTLMAWHANFERAWPELKTKYSERFARMWRYYLLSCAAYFRARQGQLWQVVLSKRSHVETYRSIRLPHMAKV